jgi:hypothetical protein
VIYNSRNPESIVDSILEIMTHRKKMHEMGIRGRKAVLRRYNWKTNLNILGKVLEEHYSVA